MSGPESVKPDDQLLDEFLAGRGVVRETYRAMAQEQAPAHLDAAILHAAQVAASPLPRLRRSRWQTPMAAAAVMVLSFGVFLQVQRDPVVQKELMAAPELPASTAVPPAIETAQDVAKAEVLSEAPPAREDAEAEMKRDVAVVARPRPVPPSEQRRFAPVDAAPPPAPPPAMAMADAPAPAAIEMAEPEAATLAADAAAQPAAVGAVASESMPRQEGYAAAPAPMAKARRAPLTANLMSQRVAPAAVASDAIVAAEIEHWAQGCGAESIAFNAPTRWRGLTVVSWVRRADDKQLLATLSFAPEVSREAIRASLGPLAAKASLTVAHCAAPAARELRQSGDGWALVCECPVAAAE
ncbi:MAG: hypothetical protein V4709_10525 [Pseudomonadota bacterium]